MDEKNNGKNNGKVFALVGIIILVLLAIIVALFFFKSDKNVSSDVILKENVHIIIKETEEQPIKVSENKLVFDDKVPYKEGDVIVSGITDTAPSGYIRKVIDVYKEGEQYTLVTENGVLTDVFEKAHIEKTFVFTADGLQEIGNENMEQAHRWNGAYVGTKFINGTFPHIMAKNILLSKEEETDYFFSYEFDEALDGGMSAEGLVGFNIWLEVKLDIENEEMVFGLIVHDEYGGEITIGWNAEGEKEYTKELLSKNIPNFEFLVGTVPIVLTNELRATLDLTASLEGTLGTTYEISSNNKAGFLYESKRGEVQEISEHNYLSEGLQFETKAEAEGDVSGGVNMHLVTKLYDCTGADISLGIVGEVEGKVGVNYGNTSDGFEYVGALEMSIKPKVQGKVIVTVPVIDKKLAEKTLFEEELKPFWEKHWEFFENTDEEIETETSEENKEPIPPPYVPSADVTTHTVGLFSFECSDEWAIDMYTEYSNFGFEISNANGSKILYIDWESEIGWGGHGTLLERYEISKVADSKVIPHPNNKTDYSPGEKFIVAKIKNVASCQPEIDEDFVAVDGATYYAVVPESYVGTMISKYKPVFYYDISFTGRNENVCCTVVATAEDGTFTAEEEKEIIEILSSFRWTD